MINIIICLLVICFCGKKDNTDSPSTRDAVVNIADVKQGRNSNATLNFSFVISIENPSAKTVTLQYTTVDGTAKANKDFEARSGTLTITPDKHSVAIDVPVKPDSIREEDKTFYVQLSNPVNATISGIGKATGTIISSGTYLPVENTGYSTPLTYPGYSLTWSDEFNGNSLDQSSWNYEIGGNGWGNNELEYYTNSTKNSFITKGGYLVLEARKETIGTNNYTSARLQTLGKREFIHGRIDIRAKLPKGKGIWPALWMLGSNIKTTPWPASGEIDIMELLGHEPNKIYGTIHWGDVGEGSTHIGKDYVLPSGDFSQTFHVFSLIWAADKIEWYVDDVKFYTAKKSDVNGDYPFDKPFFFIFNVAVGGNWPGNPDATTVFPQRMIVDYIRVFQ